MGKIALRETFQENSILVREMAYEYLKSSVLSGHFNPWERLNEEHLAKKLGVSRTPVWEALHKLELERLIKPRGTRGFTVYKDSKDEMEELFELRTILEGYTLRLISEIFTEKTLERLHEFIENAEDALKRKKIDEVYKWNTQFHDMLHSLVSHKNRLYQMILNIRKYVLRYRRDSLHYLDGAERAIDGHRKILMALRLRDPDLCERVMRNHVQEAK